MSCPTGFGGPGARVACSWPLILESADNIPVLSAPRSFGKEVAWTWTTTSKG